MVSSCNINSAPTGPEVEKNCYLPVVFILYISSTEEISEFIEIFFKNHLVTIEILVSSSLYMLKLLKFHSQRGNLDVDNEYH